MVVYNFDVGRAFSRPNEAHLKLVADPDRVLPLAITSQRLETVAWRRPQVAEIACGVEVAVVSHPGVHPGGTAPHLPVNPCKGGGANWKPAKSPVKLGDIGVAAAVLRLCSPAASFVIGVGLRIDGGFTAH